MMGQTLISKQVTLSSAEMTAAATATKKCWQVCYQEHCRHILPSKIQKINNGCHCHSRNVIQQEWQLRNTDQDDHGGSASNTMLDVIITSSNKNITSYAWSSSNNTLSNVIPIQLSPSTTRTWEGEYVQAIYRGEVCGVGNGLDRGRVDVVDDDRGMLVQEPKQPEHHSTCKRNAK